MQPYNRALFHDSQGCLSKHSDAGGISGQAAELWQDGNSGGVFHIYRKSLRETLLRVKKFPCKQSFFMGYFTASEGINCEKLFRKETEVKVMMNESRFTALAEKYMDMVYRIALNA